MTEGAPVAVVGPSFGRSPAPPSRPSRRRASLRATLTGYSFAAPNLLLLGVFLFWPLIAAAVLSLQKYSGFGQPSFLGLGNYASLFSDGEFWQALVNTVVFTAFTVVGSIGLGLAFAVLLNKTLPGRGLFRTVIYVPMVVSSVASGLIGYLIFDENTGIVDKLITAVGLPNVPWQSNGTAAMAALILMTVWGRAGFTMVIYLAGLQGISPDLYEAASIEGANAWQRFRSVTFPLLGPSTFFLLIINVIYSFQVFDLVYVLTGGGPGNATEMLTTYAYSNAFLNHQQGLAAAIGMVLLVLLVGFAALQWRTNPQRDAAE